MGTCGRTIPAAERAIDITVVFTVAAIIPQVAFHADGSAGGIVEHVLDCCLLFRYLLTRSVVGESKTHVGTGTLLPSRVGVPM